MVSKSLALALAASSLVAAQTKSLCDPTAGDDCAPNPAFGGCKKEVHEFDFRKIGSGDAWRKHKEFNDWWIPDGGVLVDDSPLTVDPERGAVFTITKKEQAPLFRSKKYAFGGKVEVAVQASAGQGIATSIVLESDNRDEIDWEWIGSDQRNVQSNFFSKGVNEFKQGRTHGVSFNIIEGFHTYGIEWSQEAISFFVDGALIRTTTPAEAEGASKWPQTPMMIKLGTWVPGKTEFPEGTISWGGGLADFSKAPFVGAYQWIKVTDYCGGRDEAGEYTYGDKSGSFDSIRVNGKSSETKDKNTTSTSVSPTASKTTSTPGPSGTGSNNNGNSNNGNSQQPDAPGAGAIVKVSSSVVFAALMGFLLLA